MNLLLIVLVRAKTNLLFEVSTENRSNQGFFLHFSKDHKSIDTCVHTHTHTLRQNTVSQWHTNNMRPLHSPKVDVGELWGCVCRETPHLSHIGPKWVWLKRVNKHRPVLLFWTPIWIFFWQIHYGLAHKIPIWANPCGSHSSCVLLGPQEGLTHCPRGLPLWAPWQFSVGKL